MSKLNQHFLALNSNNFTQVIERQINKQLNYIYKIEQHTTVQLILSNTSQNTHNHKARFETGLTNIANVKCQR